jgi:hypothetical protein
MDDLVTIEYRGVLGTLNVGDSFVVESCEAGLLKVRALPVVAPAAAPVNEQLKESDHAGS